jgi:SAM-dependent methyltransferase
MRKLVGNHTDWRSVDYKPAIPELLPHSLVPLLSPGQTALDIGCNNGRVGLFLAKCGIKTLGIDLNHDAIDTARAYAERGGVSGKACFRVADIIEEPLSGGFDAVLMIRVLTCFPDLDTWRLLLHRAHESLTERGLIYIRDFVLDEGNPMYQPRYEAGARLGWRWGNFLVSDAAGRSLFVAHHHTQEELNEILAPYGKIDLSYHSSLSMNGNACRMFEFVGRKPK